MEYPAHQTRLQRYFRNGPGGSYYREECVYLCPACEFWKAWRALETFCKGPLTWERIAQEIRERDQASARKRGVFGQ